MTAMDRIITLFLRIITSGARKNGKRSLLRAYFRASHLIAGDPTGNLKKKMIFSVVDSLPALGTNPCEQLAAWPQFDKHIFGKAKKPPPAMP